MISAPSIALDDPAAAPLWALIERTVGRAPPEKLAALWVDLGDDITRFVLVAEIEDALAIDILDHELAEVRTVGDLVALALRKHAAPAAGARA